MFTLCSAGCGQPDGERHPATPGTQSTSVHGGLRFVDVTATSGIALQNVSGDPHEKMAIPESLGQGAAALDYDGDVDVVMTVLNGQVRLFRNESARDDVLVVELRGRGGNLRGLGSVVELVAGQTVQRRWIDGGSFQSVDAPLAYFGLGGTDGLDKLALRVMWANGATVEYDGVPANRRVTVTEGDPTIHSTRLPGRRP